ncbi:MAG: hypothetical protein R6U04_09980 [Bacteroidales bacterium]
MTLSEHSESHPEKSQHMGNKNNNNLSKEDYVELTIREDIKYNEKHSCFKDKKF